MQPKRNQPLLITWLLFLIYSNVAAQNLAVSAIPEKLLKSANSVIRQAALHVEINEKHVMEVSRTWTITVLNKSGNGHLDTYEVYSNAEKITHFSAVVFDANGKEIKKFKKSDFQDVSVVNQGTLFSDYRAQFLNYTPIRYPYTMRFKVVTRSINTAFIPSWNPISYYHQSLEQSHYYLQYPASWQLSTTEHQLEKYGVIKTDENGQYMLQLSAVPAIINEYGSPDPEHFLPSAHCSLNHFSLQDVSGQADNWQQFGSWYYQHMLSGRELLPDQTLTEMKALEVSFPDPVERAYQVYRYMQAKTRYVNVAIGIGGWKPLAVADVDRLSYGDCKALSFYTMALLEAAGLPATYTIVYAGKSMKSIDTTQVSVQGNHVIVSVPLPDTTIWLETTNPHLPFGYLGSFTDNRCVLSLKEDKTYIDHTPTYVSAENLQSSYSIVSLDENGNMQASIRLRNKGSQFENRYFLERSRTEEKEDYYRKFWSHLNAVRFDSIQHTTNRKTAVFDENIALTAQAYGTISGSRMFIIPNVFNRLGNVPPRYPERKLPLQIKRGFTDIDTIHIQLPQGYVLEALPEETILESPFGTYRTQMIQSDSNTLMFERFIQIRDGYHEASAYSQYQQFRREIARKDQTPFIINKP